MEIKHFKTGKYDAINTYPKRSMIIFKPNLQCIMPNQPGIIWGIELPHLVFIRIILVYFFKIINIIKRAFVFLNQFCYKIKCCLRRKKISPGKHNLLELILSLVQSYGQHCDKKLTCIWV